VTIIAHSLGGNIALRYTGIYPENVRKLVAIEGLGPSPRSQAKREAMPIDARMRDWIETRRALSARIPRRYPSIEEAFARMQEQNKHLSPAQARHLTEQGVNQNEDGTYSWKFDNYVRGWPPYDMTYAEVEELWARITCPTLLIYGKESWASNPADDGRIRHFKTARVASFDRAGHWVHHDRLDAFLAEVRGFLAAPAPLSATPAAGKA
jgi:pimeloyl-ACP methyl ester carboxylesterase